MDFAEIDEVAGDDGNYAAVADGQDQVDGGERNEFNHFLDDGKRLPILQPGMNVDGIDGVDP